jgi:hypothetical protein
LLILRLYLLEFYFILFCYFVVAVVINLMRNILLKKIDHATIEPPLSHHWVIIEQNALNTVYTIQSKRRVAIEFITYTICIRLLLPYCCHLSSPLSLSFSISLFLITNLCVEAFVAFVCLFVFYFVLFSFSLFFNFKARRMSTPTNKRHRTGTLFNLSYINSLY